MAGQTSDNMKGTDNTRDSTDWTHLAVVFAAFSVSGVLSVGFSRMLLNVVLNLDGSIWSGSWTYRLAYLLVGPPAYSLILVAVGTLMGKHAYFRHRVLRTWGRLLPWRAVERGLSRK